ncbi:hypothetical protein OS242_10670 [Tumebacillus sp. DT12]|uniref:DUF8128 domain-containing protein n=1 Tax=Tumebacillus lacus TaxID=2995335 RepID=A0ABT3X488_9BACL|nr:hypothetical protein [Tumebacillus lacus]MCX7570426.1 hypothetical protein [Tumebacillus lacus]
MEWHIRQGAAEIRLHMPKNNRTAVEQAINTAWPRVTVCEPEADYLVDWDVKAVTGANLELREHFMFSLNVDRRSVAPMPSIFETLRLLRDDERALVQIVFVPADADWHLGAQEAYERLRNGQYPQRVALDGKAIANGAARFGARFALHASALVAELITGKEVDPEPVDPPSRLRSERPISHHTQQKTKHGAFDVTLRLVAKAEDSGRRDVILRALTTAFRSLDGDNAFEAKTVKDISKWWRHVTSREPARLKLNSDYLSIPEAARLLQLPTSGLQEEFSLNSVKHRESDLVDGILSEGIPIGTRTFRGKTEPICVPVDDHDELCLPRAVIGGMGTGKTKGFGGNFGAHALANGFSVISIDVAKDELGDEIEAGARKLGVDPRKILRLKFGERAIKLDWREALRGKRSANRLAGEMLNFFNLQGADSGVETSRYIRLAGKTIGTLGGSLGDGIRLFTDSDYRKAAIDRLETTRPDIAQDWRVFDKLSEGMRGKVTEPVLNRLDMLIGDDYLRECLECNDGIDFTPYLTGGYYVAIHVPKGGLDGLGAEATDILVDFLMSKIELAMYARPEEDQQPCFVICDEPHQFASCAPRWKRMAVESRKWRLGLIWMFHLWDQVPRSLTETIKAAGPHYHVYTTSKTILRDLAEEIAPFELNEALKTPRHHAINVMRAGGETVTPFMAKMSPPPCLW